MSERYRRTSIPLRKRIAALRAGAPEDDSEEARLRRMGYPNLANDAAAYRQKKETHSAVLCRLHGLPWTKCQLCSKPKR